MKKGPIWKSLVRKSLRVLSGVAASSLGLATTSMQQRTIQSNVVEAQKEGEKAEDIDDIANESNQKKEDDIWAHILDLQKDEIDYDLETTEGARLIAASFQMVANTFGVVANGVRVTGDTTAGVMGSSMKLAGGIVKSISNGVDGASRLIAPNEQKDRDKMINAESQQDSRGKSDTKRSMKLVKNSRDIMARSVSLAGNLVRGIGDSLLMLGAATESITSSTIAVAEDSLRLVEDLAGSIAVSLGGGADGRSSDDSEHLNVQEERPFLTFGSQPPGKRRPRPAAEKKPKSLAHRMISFAAFLIEDVEGIPSMAPEVFLVAILCFLITSWKFGKGRSRKQGAGSRTLDLSSGAYERRWRLRSWTSEWKKDRITTASALWLLLALLFVAVNFLLHGMLFLGKVAVAVLWNRKAGVVAMYGGAALYLSFAFRSRADAIRRHAEFHGFQTAIYSKDTSISESLQWVNALADQIWRVPASTLGGQAPQRYPNFVRRGMVGGRCLRCNDHSERLCTMSDCGPEYGGLEPCISSAIGNALMNALGSAKSPQPIDMVYASLYSLALGGRPPLLRSIQLEGVNHDGDRDYVIDADLLLDDMNVALEIKLSSLEHAKLPSAKVAVRSLTTKLSLRVTTIASPSPPFVSGLRLSFISVPDIDIRITPMGNDSGLQGIDLNSLPIIRDWIQGAIRVALTEFTYPKFVGIDLATLLKQPRSEKAAKVDIGRLRMETGKPLQSDPTATLHDVASVLGDTLHGRRSAKRSSKKSLLKPKTRVAQLGMERWMEKSMLAAKEEEISRSRDSHFSILSPLVASALFLAGAGAFLENIVGDGK